MQGTFGSYSDISSLIKAENPEHPVYCIYPHIYKEVATEFLSGFPGRVLYAVKANPNPTIIRILINSGIKHFDCASLTEVELVHALSPNLTKYLMIPTRIRGAAKTAFHEFGVRHFLVDHLSGLEQLVKEIDPLKSIIFARMAVHHESAMEDLSTRFGAPIEEISGLLGAIRDSGAEPAFAFNVGSSVTDPEAYRYAMDLTRQVLQELPFKLRLLDVGGGYPKSYPDFIVPELGKYFNAVRESFSAIPMDDNAEVLGEPGRALAAPGMSALVEVILRKDDRLFLNDGMFGIFWVLRIDGPNQFPVRCYRNGNLLSGEMKSFQLNGPTCDSTDTLPGRVLLPTNICVGDYLEFGNIGAYSLGGRSDYNGYFSDRIVTINKITERPPLVDN